MNYSKLFLEIEKYRVALFESNEMLEFVCNNEEERDFYAEQALAFTLQAEALGWVDDIWPMDGPNRKPSPMQ